jgi:hypothetical protein
MNCSRFFIARPLRGLASLLQFALSFGEIFVLKGEGKIIYRRGHFQAVGSTPARGERAAYGRLRRQSRIFT